MTENAGDLHALLIGIDHYPTSPLSGCVNDVDAIATWLVDRAKLAPARITRLVSAAGPWNESSPTLANIRAALEALAKVERDARVFIYYSGHGLQEIRESEARLAREALVPVDAWPAGGGHRQLLWDHEVNALLGVIGQKAHLTCVLDCCHSAGATRSPPFGENAVLADSAVRRVVEVPGTDAPTSQPSIAARGDWAEVVACEASELAREACVGAAGGRNGLFTRALLEALREIPIEDTHTVLWAEIWYSMLDRLRAWNPQQHPRQLGAWARPVLGGPSGNGDLGLRVTQPTATAYVVHAGTFAGIARGTELAVYDREPAVFPSVGSDEDVRARQGMIRVTEARGATSDAIAIGGPSFKLPDAARARVIVESPLHRFVVRFDAADEDVTSAVRNTADRMRAANLDEPGDVWCARRDGALVFGDGCYTSIAPGDARTLVAPASIAGAEIGAALEHLRRYCEPVRMARRCRDLPNALSLEVLDCTDVAVVPEAALQDPPLPRARTGDGIPEIREDQRFCVRIANASRVDLEVVGLVCCTSDGQVEFWGEGAVPALGRATFWHKGNNGRPFVAWLPEGRARVVERLIAIGTTVRGTTFAHLAHRKSLQAVIDHLRAGGARGARDVDAPQAPEPPERWTGVIQEVLFVAAPAG